MVRRAPQDGRTPELRFRALLTRYGTRQVDSRTNYEAYEAYSDHAFLSTEALDSPRPGLT
jgi:hypothetical protein